MRRSRRLAGIVASGVLGLVVLVVAGVYGFSARDLNARYDVAVTPLREAEPGPAVSVAEHGEHLAIIRGCVDCHGADGGGKAYANDPAMGRLWAPNLTTGAGGIGTRYADADWDRSVRHGVGPDRRPLIFMPSHEFWPLSDEDLASIIAYYRTLPPVDRAAPESRPGPLARLLHVTGRMALVPAKLVDHDAARPEAPAPAATVAYGAYLATGCTGCHGPGLTGGKIGGGDPTWPPAANLTPDPATGIGAWSESDFKQALRKGARPDGSEIHPAMPVKATQHMTETEMEALYVYLMSLEPRPYGQR